ncbi:hypothetical protein CMEL01_10377, partial [Colletotrichum melonis]
PSLAAACSQIGEYDQLVSSLTFSPSSLVIFRGVSIILYTVTRLVFESCPYRSPVDVCDPMLSDAGFWFVPSSARHTINSLRDQPTPR